MKYRKSSKLASIDPEGPLGMDTGSVAIAVAIILMTVLLIWFTLGTLLPAQGGGMMGGFRFTNLTNLLNIVNVLLLAFLISQYVSMYRRIHSEFTLGLIVLAYVLLVHSLMTSPLFFSNMMDWYSGPLGLLSAVFTTIAAGVLLYLNSK